MSRRTARRIALPGLAAFGLVTATPTVVWADSSTAHSSSEMTARPYGAELHVREARVGADGRTSFTEFVYVATAQGAEIRRTHSVAGGRGQGAASGRPRGATGQNAQKARPAANGTSGAARKPAAQKAPAATSSGPGGPRRPARQTPTTPKRTAHKPHQAQQPQQPRGESRRPSRPLREPRMPAMLRDSNLPQEPSMPAMPRELAGPPGF
ncbi:hypothetical protein [Actinomadura rugatobispora]|uniref:Uncharacterized protein n=1 Tax=Actinomadura rugatobispora TaxID=1994 RepID=A0ABW1A698_9ACTN|nr:hypothetical protein GCM10010200_010880 [Actinomadura rugatobispora]